MREWSRKYYQERKDEKCEYQEEYRKGHMDEERKKQRKFYEGHQEKLRKKQREYARRPENRERIRANAKKWYKEHPEKRQEIRDNYLTINGKPVRVEGKRKYLGYCELCGKENVRLAYHHWDDKHPEKGLWVCMIPCHQICEQVDKGQLHLAQRYLKFKRTLNKKMRENTERCNDD